jgi:N6-L-threonylcarbamoyladenine synthase
VNVLGIETSCDETAAAVVRDGREVLSSVVLSQVDLHRPYGGVVPEIASRSHVENLPAVIEAAVARARVPWGGVDAVAFTYGPGLATSLLVGIAAAKGLALSLGKPLCAVSHIEAHIYSVFLSPGAPAVEHVCPLVALVVSGGHTCLVRMEGPGCHELLGQTIDDAAGEAFDKGANLLGLGYPGGPAIERASRGGRSDYVRFPRGRQRKDRMRLEGVDPALCFSFSGLKTSLRYYLREHAAAADAEGNERASVAASYQEAIVDALASRCERALSGARCLAAGGGVTLNRRLRERLTALARARNVRLLLAEPAYCADNAAMIAGLAGAGQGLWGAAAMAADAEPNLRIGRARQQPQELV